MDIQNIDKVSRLISDLVKVRDEIKLAQSAIDSLRAFDTQESALTLVFRGDGGRFIHMNIDAKYLYPGLPGSCILWRNKATVDLLIDYIEQLKSTETSILGELEGQ